MASASNKNMDPNPHQIKNQNSDQHQGDKSNPDPQQSDPKNWYTVLLRITITVLYLNEPISKNKIRSP
jgi:hypothetical protein